MNSKERRELAISEIVLIVLAIIGVAVVVWLAWARPLHNTSATVNSFAACERAGNPVQTSYPEVCVTKDGKRFINPDQKVALPSANGTDDSSQPSAVNRKKLTIREWKVAFPYPDKVRSLSYTMSSPAGPVVIAFDDVPGTCKGTSILRRALQGQDLDGSGRTPAQVQDEAGSGTVKRIGEYYYMFVPGNDGSSAACDLDDEAKQQINTIMAGFTGNKVQQLVLAQ